MQINIDLFDLVTLICSEKCGHGKGLQCGLQLQHVERASKVGNGPSGE